MDSAAEGAAFAPASCTFCSCCFCSCSVWAIAVVCCAVLCCRGYSLLQKRLRQVSIPYPVAVAVESRRALGEASEISVSLCW